MKTVVLLSGGMDSSTLLYHLKDAGHECFGLVIDYGQRHVREIAAALEIAKQANIPLKVVNLTVLRDVLTGSCQTDSSLEVPEGHYADENMRLTVVPNRNMILLSVALGYAQSVGAQQVAYAAHAGDHAVYPDCRPEFVAVMQEAAKLCGFEPIELVAPFVNLTKTDICFRGATLGVPLDRTYSCYKGKHNQCGRCSTCFERREAFLESGVHDFTVYEDKTPIKDLIQEYKQK